MSINELTLDCREIALTFSMNNLTALRAKFRRALDNNNITLETYHTINKQLRDRSDWLQSRSRK